jgi:hypothetical protein
MSGFMPYVLEKGPYLSVLESRLSDPATRAQILISLKTGAPLVDMIGFDSTTLVGDGNTVDQRKQHFNNDWLGLNGQMFWVGYSGRPELILREAMTRAIEMSFGVEHGENGPPPDNAATGRHWPIDVYWICQGPWFQCWVLWRETAPGQGHVTLVMTTPAAIGYPLTSKITRPVNPADGPYTSPDYAHPPETLNPPDRHTLEKGMWVIGHEDYVPAIVFSTGGRGGKDIPIPTLGWRPVDPDHVECVSPAEKEGGVLDAPRQYVP